MCVSQPQKKNQLNLCKTFWNKMHNNSIDQQTIFYIYFFFREEAIACGSKTHIYTINREGESYHVPIIYTEIKWYVQYEIWHALTTIER